MVQIKNSVRDSVWTPEFDMRHLKKAEGHIGLNIGSVTIKMRSIVKIFCEHISIEAIGNSILDVK